MTPPNDPVSETAKATQEVAKASGKAIDAATQAGGFIAKFVSGSIEQGMGIFEDRLRYMRWERQNRLMQRADALLAELHLTGPTRPIPLKLAIPLLQGASLEDDDDLQDRWVNLLVNAGNGASGIDLHRVHIEILGQISAIEARLLDLIYDLPFEEAINGGVVTSDLPDHARLPTDGDNDMNEPPRDVQIGLGNLARLGCLRLPTTWGGGENFGRVSPTILGNSFVQACRLKRT